MLNDEGRREREFQPWSSQDIKKRERRTSIPSRLSWGSSLSLTQSLSHTHTGPRFKDRKDERQEFAISLIVKGMKKEKGITTEWTWTRKRARSMWKPRETRRLQRLRQRIPRSRRCNLERRTSSTHVCARDVPLPPRGCHEDRIPRRPRRPARAPCRKDGRWCHRPRRRTGCGSAVKHGVGTAVEPRRDEWLWYATALERESPVLRWRRYYPVGPDERCCRADRVGSGWRDAWIPETPDESRWEMVPPRTWPGS